MIGYYVHHHGRGHVNRASAIQAALYQIDPSEEIVGLSSLAKPAEWIGEWIQLPRDDSGTDPDDPTAGGALHWAPTNEHGLRQRGAQIAEWVGRRNPTVIVVDVSVEVTLLARLLGVRTIVIAQPGNRGDHPHSLAYRAASAIIAPWPTEASAMIHGLEEGAIGKLRPVGAISRFSPVEVLDGSSASPLAQSAVRRPAPAKTGLGKRVLVLNGAGGVSLPIDIHQAATSAPAWEWTVVGGAPGSWTTNVWPLIRDATVVVSHAGLNSLAEIAAARVPAVIVPQDRPFAEQIATGRQLSQPLWPALVMQGLPTHEWQTTLEAAARLDGSAWRLWCDGRGPLRAAELIRTVICTPQQVATPSIQEQAAGAGFGSRPGRT